MPITLDDSVPIVWLALASSEQRRLCAEKLLAHPEQIGRAELWRLRRLYTTLRFGAEREALDVVGTWMSRSRLDPPKVAGDVRAFHEANRAPYRYLTFRLLWEHPEAIQRLEDDYLTRDDGSCVLPVAYTLAYGYLSRGDLLAWIARLDDALADESLSGDARVSWLLARAMAAEIRGGPTNRHYRGRDRLGAGIDWLNEAALVAETPATKSQAELERAARFALIGQWNAAEDAMEAIPEGAPHDANYVTRFREAAEEKSERQRERDRDARKVSLAARAASADARGDTAKADLLRTRIDAIENADRQR